MRSHRSPNPPHITPTSRAVCFCLLLALFFTGCGTFEVALEPDEPPQSPTSQPTAAPTPSPAPLPSPVVDAADTPLTPSPEAAASPSDLPAADWQLRPPGLVYRTMETLWQINQREQPVAMGNYEAVLSADSRRLLSYDFAGQDIWFHDLTGGPSRQLTHTPDRIEQNFSWWPQQPGLIVFNSFAAGDEGYPGRMGYLTLLNLGDSSYQIVDDQHDTGPTGFALSPDGRAIAYGGGEQGWIYHLDSGTQPFNPADYALTGAKGVQIGSPAYSPDGTRLAWMVNGGLGEQGEFLMAIALFDLNNGTARLLHPYEPMGRGGWPLPPVWSPDGRWLAFTAGPVNLDEAGVWVISAEENQNESHYFGHGGTPVWSPDSRWLAFTHFPDNGPSELLAVETGVWSTMPITMPPDGSGYYLTDWITPQS